MKYKVGDKVTIRSWEAMEREYGLLCGSIDTGCPLFVSFQRSYCGQTVTITEVDYVFTGYKIKEDNGKFKWTDQMIAHNFVYGEEIEVSNNDDVWEKRAFVGFIDGCITSYCCARIYDTDIYLKALSKNKFSVQAWPNARKIQPTPKIDISVKVNGVNVSPSTLSKETWDNLRSVK